MRRERTRTMAEAARAVGIGRTTLFRLLRAGRHFGPGNVPEISLLRAGYFRLVERTFTHPTTGRQMRYVRVEVTPAGIHWLRELIDAQQRPNSAPAVGGRNNGVGIASRAAGDAGASASALPADRRNTSEKSLGAPSCAAEPVTPCN